MFSQEFKNRIIEAKSAVVLTGAGVSKESGLDTFRDPGGFWSQHNPMDLASQGGFAENPKLVWQWYMFRRNTLTNAKPNPGHFALKEMENLFESFAIFTQNVDRLHHQAGSRKVYELHGNIIESHCNDCGLVYLDEIDVEKALPVCPVCKGFVRPSVVWFGEQLPEDVLESAVDWTRSADLFFTIGTSAEVYPAAQLPHLAKESGAYVVEINPNPTSFTRFADLSLREPSGIILPQILELIREIRLND